MSVLTEKYNKDLQYFYDAANKNDNPLVPNAAAEKWQPRFAKLLYDMNALVEQIEQELGREMTEDEIINGFKEGGI